jgi:hypothetical protein
MAPTPHIRPNEPLERGQTTIFGTLNGGISIQRPPLPPRLGRVPKSTGQANMVLGRRLIGGLNEKQVLELFAIVRLTQNEDGEPRDTDIANGTIPLDEDEEEEEFEYLPMKRYAYSREHKLAMIDYFQTTWKELKDSTYERMSTWYAAQKLKISHK